MPPRYLTLAIVGFWLATVGWLFQRDLKPRLWPAGPPPFTIDITDEAQSTVSVHWDIFQDGEIKGYSETGIRYFPEDDTYELKGLYKFWTTGVVGTGIADQIIDSGYRVTREGQLRAIRAEVTIRQKVPFNLAGIKNFQVEAQVEGQVKDRLFKPHGKIKATNLDNPDEQFEMPFDLEGVSVADQGSVLNPLQPLNRLPNIRPGQTWSMPIVDPLTQALQESAKAIVGPKLAEALKGTGSSVSVLHARVLPKPQILVWGDDREKQEVLCLVIEYEGEDIRLRTWVRQDNSLILQQEIKKGDHELVLVRGFKTPKKFGEHQR